MMNAEVNKIRCYPYVPGKVSGSLNYCFEKSNGNDIAVVAQRDIEHLEQGWAGIIVIEGAPFSHAMVRILGFAVPTMIVSANDAKHLKEGMQVLLDADNGLILLEVDPGEHPVLPMTIKSPASGKPVLSRDGVTVNLRASVRDVHGVKKAKQYGAESIGLVRSEFLVPDNAEQPGATFYRHVFSEIAMAAQPLTVTMRLLDLASDKKPAWVSEKGGLNTPLGLQGSRLFYTGQVKEVFHGQLDALDQLVEQYDLRVLIPYLVKREEISFWVNEIRNQMQNPVSIGAMVETPAGAIDAANWFDLVDFVAIGCNDLMQCLFAADRDQPELRDYLDPYAPLLYRFFQQVAGSLKSQLDNVQLCGVLPQLQGVLPVLLGLGFRNYSVEPRLIPWLAQIVETTNVTDAMQLASKVCESKETSEVKRLMGLTV